MTMDIEGGDFWASEESQDSQDSQAVRQSDSRTVGQSVSRTVRQSHSFGNFLTISLTLERPASVST